MLQRLTLIVSALAPALALALAGCVSAGAGLLAAPAGEVAEVATPGPPPLSYPPDIGPGGGRHIVLVAGEEEYRSEEALPQLAKILAARHGFRCTVLFSTDPRDGTIDPAARDHIPGLEALDDADLLVIFTRFRQLPDADMKHLVDFVNSKRPVIGLRTATHAFAYDPGSASPYAGWSWDSADPGSPGGFGQQILGASWAGQPGRQGEESTRGTVPAAAAGHVILHGVAGVWAPSDVYAVPELPPDATVLLEGASLAGMTPDAPASGGEREAARTPVAWTREIALRGSGCQRVLCSTLGAAADLRSEDLRRLLVNACYWCLMLGQDIPERADVSLVGDYDPSPSGEGGHRKGVRPADLALPALP